MIKQKTVKQQKDLLIRKGNMLRNNKLAWELIQDYLTICKEQNKIVSIEEFHTALEKQFSKL